MKSLAAFLLTVATIHGGTNAPVSLIGSVITFTNTAGRVYESVRIVQIDPDGIVWMPESGLSGGKVFWRDVPVHLQSSCGYDPAAAAAFEKQKRAEEIRVRKMEAVVRSAAAARRASTATSAQLHFDRAKRLLESNDPLKMSQAPNAFAEAATLGHVNAMMQLGHFFKAGKLVPKNVGEAARWYRMAADRGDADALTALAEIARGNLQNPNETALALYHKAAEAGSHAANVFLGNLYRLGNGVRRSRERAHYYFERAHDFNAVANLYRSGGSFPPDARECLKWSRIASFADGRSYVRTEELIAGMSSEEIAGIERAAELYVSKLPPEARKPRRR